jgi:CPA2 family monovalent cation:H+ antiporter-2
MLFDPRFVWEHAGQVAAVTLLIIFGKALIIGLLARAFGYTKMAPWIIGLGLTCTILTMALSPLVLGAALPLGRMWERWHKPA